MGTGMTVHDREELQGGSKGAVSLDHSREAASIALANRPGFDVADMDPEQFNAGLQKIKVRQHRMQAVIDTIMVDGVHYITKDKKGNKIFDRPHMTIAGGAELRNFFRLTCKTIGPPEIFATAEFVSVTVNVGCFDSAGRLLGARAGSCNTMEKRFQKRSGDGWIYVDAREMTHQCVTMAEKRGAALITKEVTGAVAFFASEEEMDKALAAELEEEDPKKKKKPVAWTKEEEDQVKAAAKDAGMAKHRDLREFIGATLGRGFVGTGEDVSKLLAAIADKKRGGPVKDGGEGYGGEPPSTAAADPAQRSAEDVQADLELAGKDQQRHREPGEKG